MCYFIFTYLFFYHFIIFLIFFFFFFNDTATTEIYTLSLHDALPILLGSRVEPAPYRLAQTRPISGRSPTKDRKSTRLNSSHVEISYAVFCLKKKKKNNEKLKLKATKLYN